MSYFQVNRSLDFLSWLKTRGTPMKGVVTPSGKEFTADHPFLFLVRDSQSGLILFAGRVVFPEDG